MKKWSLMGLQLQCCQGLAQGAAADSLGEGDLSEQSHPPPRGRAPQHGQGQSVNKASSP